MKEIVKIHGTSSQVTFDLEDGIIIGSGEFRAKSGKIDGFILYSDSLRYEDGKYLSLDERYKLKQLYELFVLDHYDSIDWDI